MEGTFLTGDQYNTCLRHLSGAHFLVEARKCPCCNGVVNAKARRAGCCAGAKSTRGRYGVAGQLY
eukprot:10553636-Lingulodinium_polyedra.AAC.1